MIFVITTPGQRPILAGHHGSCLYLPTPGRLREEDCCTFHTNLGCLRTNKTQTNSPPTPYTGLLSLQLSFLCNTSNQSITTEHREAFNSLKPKGSGKGIEVQKPGKKPGRGQGRETGRSCAHTSNPSTWWIFEPGLHGETLSQNRKKMWQREATLICSSPYFW